MMMPFESQTVQTSTLSFHIVIKKKYIFCKLKFTLCQKVNLVTAFGITLHGR